MTGYPGEGTGLVPINWAFQSIPLQEEESRIEIYGFPYAEIILLNSLKLNSVYGISCSSAVLVIFSQYHSICNMHHRYFIGALAH